MAEIEKKYSDYQESECVTEISEDIIGEKLCVTCQKNPDWVLPAPHWSDIKEAYLNEKVCEYHVRVYENEPAVAEKLSLLLLKEAILTIAAGRMLVDLDKPLNDGTRTQVKNAAYIVETYRDEYFGQFGKAYLVAAPAFNFDQIESNDSENAEQDESDGLGSSGEIILDFDGLYRKLQQLNYALKTYKFYYSAAQRTGSGFVIRQADNEIQRINYEETRKKLKQFRKALNKAISDKGYQKLGNTGLFKSKRAKRIKFTFRDNGKTFDLKKLFVLSDDGCGKYEKIPVKSSSILRAESMAVIYNFLSNLDNIINDITAKQTKPWLDFTLQYFYPTYIVDYGNLGEIEDVKSGLECLLEMELGLGNGQVIDAVTKEIMSAFDSIERQMAEQACRSLSEISSGGATALSEASINNSKSPEEERKNAMLARYQKEFKNKAIKQLVDNLNDHIEDLNGVREETVNDKNVFETIDAIMGRGTHDYVSFSYKFKGETIEYEAYIYNEELLESHARDYAVQKFEHLESGNFGNQIQNSPHYQQAKDAALEVVAKFDNTYIQTVKEAYSGVSDLELPDVMSAIGICGVSKISGKALECLASGVSFDKFIDTIVDKSFDFMEAKTLSLFMNGLPITLRAELNQAIEKQFGNNVNLGTLLNLQTTIDPNIKLKDLLKIKTKSDEVYDTLVQMVGMVTEDELRETSGLYRFYDKYITPEQKAFLEKALYPVDAKIFYERIFVATRDGKMEDEYLLKQTKKGIKAKLWQKKPELFRAAIERVGKSLNAEDTTVPEEEMSQLEKAANSFEETALGVKVDAVFDVVFDFAIDYVKESLGIEKLFEILKSYPAIDFFIDKIEQLLNPCPVAPMVYPPAKDFMKSLSVDVCDPTVSLTLPKINIPNINFRFQIETQFGEIFREAIIKVVSDAAIGILTKLMTTIESSLCKVVGAAGTLVADGLSGNLKDSFYEALNEAFCNDGVNPDTGEQKAKELADALFNPITFDAGANYENSGAKISNILSSVATTGEFLGAMVARDGDEDEQFNNRVANAINFLAPEMNSILGDPSQVAYFFKNLGSFLPDEDRERIRNLLEDDIPNLPISSAICLTNDQLNEWNNLREQLLAGDNPADAVRSLNDATENALEDIAGIVGDLDTDGPFLGAATNEAMKDVCNPNNLFNDVSQSDADRAAEDELIESFFDNIQQSLTNGFFNKGGLLAEAMKDTLDRREFGRSFQKLFRANYSNSQQERDLKFSEGSKALKFIMNIGYDDTDGAPGVYPETVGIKQRDEILENGISLDFDKVKEGRRSSKNVVYKYEDQDDGLFGFSYKQMVAASNLREIKTTFGYNLQVIENVNDNGDVVEINFNTQVPLSEEERSLLSSRALNPRTNIEKDLRKATFSTLMRQNIGTQLNYGLLYENIFSKSQNNIVEALLTDYSKEDGIPNGYKYGYTSDDLTRSSFEYTPSENEGELGTFASPRVIPLDPNIYGGNYNNPPFYVEPRKFSGWLELATSAFTSQEGCDPKTPPLMSFDDIKARTKTLSNQLRNDPRMSKSPECVSVKPFHVLLDNKNKSKLDGVVRTTIRTYLAEFFMKGYGLFSNLQIKPENFDDSMMQYIVEKMRKEMSDLGTFTSNRKVRIVRERYWYTFLEQSVEAYQRMIDVDGVEPSELVFNTLNKIQQGLDAYRSINKDMKKNIRENFDNINKNRPSANYDALEEVSRGMRRHMVMAVAFRLANEEERENFFNGQEETKVKASTFRFSSLKKLKFFQKIYFIKLFEREATLIMRELIKDELSRLSQLVIDGPTDKPYYLDLYKSFFGMRSFFPNSTSRVGTNPYEFDKQRGVLAPGSIPSVMSSNAQAPVGQTDEVQFIVESYARMEERQGVEIPDFIRNRSVKYTGAISLTDLSEFISSNLSALEDNYISDYFGDLSFVYQGSFLSLMKKGFDQEEYKRMLITLNPDLEEQIQTSFNNFKASQTFQDFAVTYDETFVGEGENPTPTGTTGSSGIKYGIRVSAVVPSDFISAEKLQELKNDANLVYRSQLEKSLLFEDGVLVLPLVQEEMHVVDAKFLHFDPFNGAEPYDLECLINKIVKKPEFTLMFDKLFNFRQASSMLSIYCMETLPASIGRGEGERAEGASNSPDVDDWDRTINKFGKNFLRREFKSIYLSNTEDGLSPDEGDDDSELLSFMKLNNPFDFFSRPSVKLPWWMKRKMKTKIYDANGQECADPEKDLL